MRALILMRALLRAIANETLAKLDGEFEALDKDRSRHLIPPALDPEAAAVARDDVADAFSVCSAKVADFQP